MATDKHIIALLLDALEKSHIERTMLVTMIMTYRDRFPQIGDWEKDLDTLRQQKSGDVRKQFAQLRDAVARSHNVESALQQFLKDNPPKGSVH